MRPLLNEKELKLNRYELLSPTLQIIEKIFLFDTTLYRIGLTTVF